MGYIPDPFSILAYFLNTMLFRRKKKQKKDDSQLLLFSNEEMSGKESPTAIPESDLAIAQEEKATDKEDVGNMEGNVGPIEERDSNEETTEEKAEAEEALSQSLEDDPFSPFIDDPESTSERIIHEMTAAMTLLDRFSVSQVRLIAMQAAPIAQSGVDFSKIYQLPSLPGFSMSGYSMLALSYVSFKRVFPGMIDRLYQDFTKEYEAALRQYKAV
jgi:hypothetical protein